MYQKVEPQSFQMICIATDGAPATTGPKLQADADEIVVIFRPKEQRFPHAEVPFSIPCYLGVAV
jgi:hypothetical protein